MTRKTQAFSATKRRSLIAGIDKAFQAMQAAGQSAQADGKGDGAYEAAYKRYQKAAEAYEKALPRPAISRSPFSGEMLHYAIDTGGLNGPWWNRDMPVRPIEEVPSDLLAVTGAVDFGKRAPKTNFVVTPGPGVPYVVPRMLVDPAVKAVVSCKTIGKHTAYPVVYFAQDVPFDMARVNTWGLDHYVGESGQGEGYVFSIPDYWIDFDFDLAFYIQTGRLLWIAPGDERLTLRSTLRDCPYLDMPGHRHPAGILNGTIWNTLLDPQEGEQAA